MNKKVPTVSVIIPSYNSAPYLPETLDSILSQSYQDFEIIVVDDGSTDNTREVIQPFLKYINYVYEKNKGPAPARNTGIRAAKGKFIAFNDSDDTWLPQKLAIQIDYFQNHPEIGLVYTDVILFSEEGIPSPVKFEPNSGNGFYRLLLKNYIPTMAVMVKRECFDKVGLFDERPEVEAAEDYDMWLRITRQFQIGYIEQKLAKHRVRKSSHSRNLDRQISAGIFVKRRILDTLPDTKEMRKIKNNCWRDFHIKAGYAYFYQNDYNKARHQFYHAFKYRGVDFKNLIFFSATFLPSNIVHLFRTNTAKSTNIKSN